jgi:glycosyltransferase involved in cell wall biosynthesis
VQVLFVVSHYRASGGHESVMNSLAIGLSKLGHEVTIGAFSFEKSPPDPIPKVLLKKTRNLPYQLNRNKRIDIIHSHHAKMNYYSLLSPGRFIFHHHGASNTLQRLNLKISFFLCQKKISKVIYVSNSSMVQTRREAGHASEGVPSVVIYNGVDTVFYNTALPKKYKIGDPQLLFVGNLYRHKNLTRIIEEMPQIIQDFPDVHLQIVGDGEGYGEIKESIDRHKLRDHVELTGKITDTEELRLRYSSCDIYLSASMIEAHPVPLLEAMACGKPVLVSGIPPHVEAVRSSNAGRIFSFEDRCGIRKGILNILNEFNRFASNARGFAEKNDWSHVCMRVSGVYDELMDL